MPSSLLALTLALSLSPADRLEAPIQSAAPAAPAVADELRARIDAIAAEHLARPGGVGLSVAVGRGDELLLELGYGLADVELDVPADARTMFRIGSITKQFTAAAVMRLVEAGALELDAPISDYLPDLPTAWRAVTLHQLLNHTSGIPSYTDLGAAWEAVWPLELSHAELLALVRDRPLDFEPGTRWAYNNTGYYLLGMLIEELSGSSYAEHLARDLFEPLGLSRTRRDSNVDVIRNRAQGYALVDGELANDQPYGTSQPGAAGTLLSSAGDLVRWQIALSRGEVVAPESFARMTAPTELPGAKARQYGYGLGFDELEGRRRIQHGGGIFGFNSMLFWLPDEDLHVAVISNGEALRSDKVADDVARAVLGIERAPVKDEPIPAELRAELAGTFALDDLGLEVSIEARATGLSAQATGQPAFGLLWQGGLEFRADFDPDVRLVFEAGGAGFTLYQSGARFEAQRKR